MATQPVRTSDAVVFLPGIMGSQLVDAEGEVLWGMRPKLLFRQLTFRDVLKRLALDEEASDDGITANALLEWPVKLPLLGAVEPYRAIVKRLEETVEDPAALLPFPYDWRRSIASNGERLRHAAREHLRDWRARRLAAAPSAAGEPPKLTFVCHSMGGLVARYAVEVLGDDLKSDVRRIVTLGTPFRGAVKALRILATGKYLPLGVLADELRDTSRTLPGIYELLARYKCLVDGSSVRALEPSDLAAVGASDRLASAAFEVMDRLHAAGDAVGATEIRPMVGLDQPTLQSARIANGVADFMEHLNSVDEGGDGTVFRRSALPAGTTAAAGYLPQTHGLITKSGEALTFVHAALTEDTLGPLQAPPKGTGIRVPEAVLVGQPIEIEIQPAGARPTCRIQDPEAVGSATIRVQSRGGQLVASTVRHEPGLYRVLVSGGGMSPVQDLVAVVAPE